MFTDLTGKKRLKIGLHTHTNVSDGRLSPMEAAQKYAEEGYDILALTDHWKYGVPFQIGQMSVISGCEYDLSTYDEKYGINHIFHIVGLNMKEEPKLTRNMVSDDNEAGLTFYERTKLIVDKIREAGGIAVLAHPAWSLNDPEQIMGVGDFDALEIYNSVSECGMSDRPYSGQIVDMLASKGIGYPLFATDDTHYYNGDECRGMIMMEEEAYRELGFEGAIKAEKFYATQGPEIHMERISEDEIKVICSPAVKIAFHSNLFWTSGRVLRGENLTEMVYTIKHDQHEKFVRAEVTDKDGLAAWSNLIWI